MEMDSKMIDNIILRNNENRSIGESNDYEGSTLPYKRIAVFVFCSLNNTVLVD